MQVAAVLAEAEGAEERLLERACHRRRVRSGSVRVATPKVQGSAQQTWGWGAWDEQVFVWSVRYLGEFGGLCRTGGALKVCVIVYAESSTSPGPAHTKKTTQILVG